MLVLNSRVSDTPLGALGFLALALSRRGIFFRKKATPLGHYRPDVTDAVAYPNWFALHLVRFIFEVIRIKLLHERLFIVQNATDSGLGFSVVPDLL